MFAKKWVISILVMVTWLWLCNPEMTLAGCGYELKCMNKECNYTDRVSFGGGFRFEQITGYCVNYGEFVYLVWDREDEEGDIDAKKK